MPCAMTPGRLTDVATRSLQWMGLKSPDAPAYRIRSERVTSYDFGSKACPASQLIRNPHLRRPLRRPCTSVAYAVATGSPSTVAISVRVPIMSIPAAARRESIVIVPESSSPARMGRVYSKRWSPWTTFCSSMPTLGSVISCVIAPNAITIGNVSGAVSPSSRG